MVFRPEHQTSIAQSQSAPRGPVEAPAHKRAPTAKRSNTVVRIEATGPPFRHPGAREIVYTSFKRALDIAIVCFLAPLWLPLYLVICGLILIVDGRPVHYPDLRVGRFGREFACLKFRSMRAPARETQLSSILDDGKEAGGSSTARFEKAVADPRVSKLGRILRRWSLDELPQVINILRGEMSLVGPRPVTRPELAKYYGDRTPLLLSVPPGLTGLWQISGRSTLPAERRVVLDISYVTARSLRMDLVIVLKTVPSVLRGRGAF